MSQRTLLRVVDVLLPGTVQERAQMLCALSSRNVADRTFVTDARKARRIGSPFVLLYAPAIYRVVSVVLTGRARISIVENDDTAVYFPRERITRPYISTKHQPSSR